MDVFKRNLFLWFSLVSVVLVFTACSESNNDSRPFEVINDDSELEKRYTEKNSTINIDSTDGSGYKSRYKQKKAKFSLTLTAELSAPSVGTDGIQATMVSINGNSSRATVSYNKQGSSYQGSIDVLQVTSGNAKSMRIRSSVEFFDSDVNAVFAGDNRVWGALATENPELSNSSDRSALQGFAFSGFDIEAIDDLSVSLPSFAANAVKEYDNRIFATSGTDGGLSVYSQDLSEELNYTELRDARWVDVNGDYLVVLLGDSNDDGKGEIVVMNPNTYDIQNRYPFVGASTPEAKNTVEVIEHLAFIAAGVEGMKVMDLTTGEIVAEIPRPDPSELGISDQRVMTNAVSVDEDKIFISNGEAGVYVAEADQNIDRYNPGEQLNITVLGKLTFDDLESVNHVSYRSKMLVVAAGAGGAKIVRLDAK